MPCFLVALAAQVARVQVLEQPQRIARARRVVVVVVVCRRREQRLQAAQAARACILVLVAQTQAARVQRSVITALVAAEAHHWQAQARLVARESMDLAAAVAVRQP